MYIDSWVLWAVFWVIVCAILAYGNVLAFIAFILLVVICLIPVICISAIPISFCFLWGYWGSVYPFLSLLTQIGIVLVAIGVLIYFIDKRFDEKLNRKYPPFVQKD